MNSNEALAYSRIDFPEATGVGMLSITSSAEKSTDAREFGLQQHLLAFQNITKRFGGTTALRDVSLHLEAGEVLALLGENGAGKSTLIKSLAGIHTPDEGRILFKGEALYAQAAKAQ